MTKHLSKHGRKTAYAVCGLLFIFLGLISAFLLSIYNWSVDRGFLIAGLIGLWFTFVSLFGVLRIIDYDFNTYRHFGNSIVLALAITIIYVEELLSLFLNDKRIAVMGIFLFIFIMVIGWLISYLLSFLYTWIGE